MWLIVGVHSAHFLSIILSSAPDSTTADVFISNGHFVSEESDGFEPLEGDFIVLFFLDGDRIDFSASCNSFGGHFEIQNGRLELGELSQTEMSCDEERMAQDEWLHEYFSDSPMIAESDERITLSNLETNLVFIERDGVWSMPCSYQAVLKSFPSLIPLL